MKKRITAFAVLIIMAFQCFSAVYALDNKEPESNTETEYISEIDLSDYSDNEILILYKDGSVETKKFDTADELENAVYKLKNDDSVDVVQPNYKYENTSYSVNDSLYINQWGLSNRGSAVMRENQAFTLEDGTVNKKEIAYVSEEGMDIDAEGAWEEYSAKKDVIIALIDTGVNIDHEDLKDVFWINQDEISGNGIDDDENGYVDDVYGYNFYDNSPEIYVGAEDSHGTHCAGTIAAIRNNALGIAGIASFSNIKIMPLKALGGEGGSGSTAGIIKAIKYAEENGAEICNLSFCSENNDIALYKTMAKSKMLFVVAAGNNDIGINIDVKNIYPAVYNIENMITVGNIRSDGQYDPTSNYGAENVDIAAPGNHILSTTYNSYGYMTGTSMSAPMVTAVCALVYSHYDGINLKDTKEIVLNTSKKLDSLTGKVKTAGMLNAAEALRYDVSSLSHLDFQVPDEAYIEDMPVEMTFEVYNEKGLNYLRVKAVDINDDIFCLRYKKGIYSAEDFKEGISGTGFVLDKDNTCTFVVRSPGSYTFYARDKAGNETISNVEITF